MNIGRLPRRGTDRARPAILHRLGTQAQGGGEGAVVAIDSEMSKRDERGIESTFIIPRDVLAMERAALATRNRGSLLRRDKTNCLE